MKIIFVRHADKETEGENPNLTKKGLKQARYLAKRLKKERINEFYSSDLKRTIQTAEEIKKVLKKKFILESALREFEMNTIKKNKKSLTKKEKEKIKNLKKFLDKISKEKNNEKTTLIIAHGITNRLIISHFLGITPKNLITFFQRETCVNEIEWNEKYKNWRLKLMGDNNHLPKKLK